MDEVNICSLSVSHASHIEFQAYHHHEMVSSSPQHVSSLENNTLHTHIHLSLEYCSCDGQPFVAVGRRRGGSAADLLLGKFAQHMLLHFARAGFGEVGEDHVTRRLKLCHMVSAVIDHVRRRKRRVFTQRNERAPEMVMLCGSARQTARKSKSIHHFTEFRPISRRPSPRLPPPRSSGERTARPLSRRMRCSRHH